MSEYKTKTDEVSGRTLCDKCTLPIREWGEVYIRDARSGAHEGTLCKPCNALRIREDKQALRVVEVDPVAREIAKLQARIDVMLKGEVDQAEFLKVVHDLLSIMKYMSEGGWR